jgi:ferredoxin
MFRPIEDKERREQGKAPEFFEIYMVFKAYGDKFCPDCLKCVEVCPKQAIEIKI